MAYSRFKRWGGFRRSFRSFGRTKYKTSFFSIRGFKTYLFLLVKLVAVAAVCFFAYKLIKGKGKLSGMNVPTFGKKSK